MQETNTKEKEKIAIEKFESWYALNHSGEQGLKLIMQMAYLEGFKEGVNLDE